MIINLPESVGARKLLDASRPGQLPVYTEEFGDGSGFTFDAQSPRGVRYLPREEFEALVGRGRCGAHADAAVPHGREVRPTPLRRFSVWLHISNACNLACTYCYIPHLTKAVDPKTMARNFMSASTIETATNALFDFCVAKGYGELHIKFAGGEPTLDVDRIEATCLFARRQSKLYSMAVSFSILTNGVFVDRNIFSTLRRHAIATSISVDGAPLAHDRIRFTVARQAEEGSSKAGRVVREGTRARIYGNIRDLLDQRIRPYMLCTVTRANMASLMEFVEFCAVNRLGFRLSLVRDASTHRDVDFRRALIMKLAEAYDWLGNHMPVDLPIERYARFAEWLPTMKKESVCGSCKSSVAINQEGDVASCQMRMDKSFGNVHRESLVNAFNNMQMAEDNRYLVAPAAKSGDCSRCYWKYVCAGGCPEHSRIALGTLNVPSPWCEVYRELLPHYLRAIGMQAKRRIEGFP